MVVKVRTRHPQRCYVKSQHYPENREVAQKDDADERAQLFKGSPVPQLFCKVSLVKPFWVEVFTKCIKPERQKAASEGKGRKRGPSLKDVQTRLTEGRSSGRMKYSRIHANKQEWTVIDHFARFLHQARY